MASVARPGKLARPRGDSRQEREKRSRMQKLTHAIVDNSLTIVLFALFVVCIFAQSFAGWRLQKIRVLFDLQGAHDAPKRKVAAAVRLNPVKLSDWPQ